MATDFKSNKLEQIRGTLYQQGYAEFNVIAKNFDNSPAVGIFIDGLSDLAVTFPVPDGCMVYAEIQYATFLSDTDGSVDSATSGSLASAGYRPLGGNVSDVEQINTAFEIVSSVAEFNTTDAATAGTLTFSASADTTNQGILITVANDSADEVGDLFGRIRLICAVKDGRKTTLVT